MYASFALALVVLACLTFAVLLGTMLREDRLAAESRCPVKGQWHVIGRDENGAGLVRHGPYTYSEAIAKAKRWRKATAHYTVDLSR